MSSIKHINHSVRDGFTMVEVMMASAISTVVVFGLIAFLISTYSYWHGVNLRMEADSDVNIAMSRLVYGMGGTGQLGLRAASMQSVAITTSGGGWTVKYDTGGATPQHNSFTYSKTGRTLMFNPGNKIAGRDIGLAELTLEPRGIDIKLRVDKTRGKLKASREITTMIHFRNRLN